jgi:hypothetical protein
VGGGTLLKKSLNGLLQFRQLEAVRYENSNQLIVYGVPGYLVLCAEFAIRNSHLLLVIRHL